MLALGNRNSPGGHQRAMLPEHVGTGDFILSPQVLKGEGFAFLPPLLAILLWMPLIPAYPGLPSSDLGQHPLQTKEAFNVLKFSEGRS